MRRETPPTAPTPAGDAPALGERPRDAPAERVETVADDLHLLRLACQLADYELAGTTGDEWAALDPGRHA